MKGLFLAFGLIAALFVSNNVQASIYQSAGFVNPKSTSSTMGECRILRPSSIAYQNYTLDSCINLATENIHQSVNSTIYKPLGTCASQPGYEPYKYQIVKILSPDGKVTNLFRYFTNCISGDTSTNNQINYMTYTPYGVSDESKSCPPDSSPNYTFGQDFDSDGKIDKCFNPNELDSLSKCSDLFNSGSILVAGNNTAPLVCKTFEDGSRCAFSRVNQGSTPYYQPNLEKGCFGDAEQIPDYDKNANEPQPQPEQCVPYAGGYACAADPKDYCTNQYDCVDGCGYVNSQFVCFRDEQCTGENCQPAPVDCTTVPDAPICKPDTPTPSYCQQNPTASNCQPNTDFCKLNPTAPSCTSGGSGGGTGGGTGGGGGGGGFEFSLDYEKLISGMKDAAKSLIDESPIPENSEMDKSLDDENKGIKSDYDNFLENGVFNEIKATSQRTVFSSLESIFPSGSANCSFNFGEFNIEICSTAEKIRSLLYWVFAILTLIYLRHLFYSTISTNAGK